MRRSPLPQILETLMEARVQEKMVSLPSLQLRKC